jgi:hypothetical protein
LKSLDRQERTCWEQLAPARLRGREAHCAGTAVWIAVVAFMAACGATSEASPPRVPESSPSDRLAAGRLTFAPAAPPAALPAGRPPRLPARAAGSGWVCIKSLDFEEMSSCFRDESQCTLTHEKLGQSGLRYGPCLGQARAACFTFHNVLQGIDTFDCSATIEACERQRTNAAAKTRDVTGVSDCGGVD